MQAEILQQGVDLMLFGMGSVFVFLTVLVIATTCMSSVMQRFFPDIIKPLPAAAAPPKQGVNDPKLQAIIKAAIDKHRARHK